jgi:LysM repeat protein
MRASHQLSPVLAAVVVAALFVSSASTALAQTTTHTVQPSENLFRIGLRYGVSWQAIMQANGLTSTTIYVGQQLVIPVEGAPPAVAPTPTPQLAAPTPPATPPPPAPAPAPAPAASTYIVQRGDTLFRIATRFGLTTAQLAAANNIFNPALIYPGQVLAIPGSATGENPNPAAPPPSTGAGKRILVDISEQHLYAYEGDQLIFSFVASTGAPGLGTRPGNYSVQNKIPNAYGGTWNIWMPNWLGIYWAGSLQNGIHALPILPDGSRLWAGYLGTPVSYGCVILGVQESQQLYDWAEVGIPVDIQY